MQEMTVKQVKDLLKDKTVSQVFVMLKVGETFTYVRVSKASVFSAIKGCADYRMIQASGGADLCLFLG